MKVFVSGSISLKALSQQAIEHLDSIMSNGDTVLIGDAYGIDKAVQSYLFECQYPSVTIYYSGEKIRNNIGDWETVQIPCENEMSNKLRYRLKDMAMAHDADCGLMIWDGKSTGTRFNIENMTMLNKPFRVVPQVRN